MHNKKYKQSALRKAREISEDALPFGYCNYGDCI